MWYEILIKNKYADYFMCDDILEDETVKDQMLHGYSEIVSGIYIAWVCCDIRDPGFMEAVKRGYSPDFVRAFEFCRANLDLDSVQPYDLPNTWHSVPREPGQSRYETDISLLSAEQCAVMIMYPFCSRMGGSFEKKFAEDGRLKKYLLALKEKCK